MDVAPSFLPCSNASMSISRVTLSGENSATSYANDQNARAFSDTSMSSALSEEPFQAQVLKDWHGVSLCVKHEPSVQ